MKTCQEPIGITQKEPALCGDPAVANCVPCSIQVCNFHRKIHKDRHEYFEGLKKGVKVK